MSTLAPALRAAATYATAESRELVKLADDLARLVAAQFPPKPSK